MKLNKNERVYLKILFGVTNHKIQYLHNNPSKGMKKIYKTAMNSLVKKGMVIFQSSFPELTDYTKQYIRIYDF